MEIALLTIWREKNYGAELQAYATVKILQQYGCDVRMVNIRLSDMRKLSIKERVANQIECFLPGHLKFVRFWKKYIPTTRRYKTVEDIIRNPPEADIYMVGSDQVWNNDITKDFFFLFFLNFGPHNKKRISYASSFGKETWDFDSKTKEVKKLLSRFQYITTRESSGAKIVNDIFQLHAEVVLDPTLLLDDYSILTKKVIQKQQLAYYPLSDDEELESCSIRISKLLGLTPLNINRKNSFMRKICYNRTSIENWIKGIAESNFIITRSFHGVIFSIIYKKQFAVLASRNGRGTRLENLLNALGLESRIFSTADDLERSQPWRYPINYTEITPKLLEMRTNSLGVLKKLLEM